MRMRGSHCQSYNGWAFFSATTAFDATYVVIERRRDGRCEQQRRCTIDDYPMREREAAHVCVHRPIVYKLVAWDLFAVPIERTPAISSDTKADRTAMKSILEPGRNCWRIERADRLAFLVDGAAYFRAQRDALKQARESMLILSWDIYSRLRLVRDEGADDGWPASLGECLDALVRRRRKLRGHILSWDFAMIFALDRVWLPIFKLNLKTHRRLHFHMDDCHPLGGSHHQKVVVIDDQLAFAGGLDLTLGRWDTPDHVPDDPRLIELNPKPTRPYHDVQVAVSGAAARALGELARKRWRCATGKILRAPSRALGADALSGGGGPGRAGGGGAGARTGPGGGGGEEVRESERLYLDAIAAAERCIYIENQYFTSAVIAEALAAGSGRRKVPSSSSCCRTAPKAGSPR